MQNFQDCQFETVFWMREILDTLYPLKLIKKKSQKENNIPTLYILRINEIANYLSGRAWLTMKLYTMCTCLFLYHSSDSDICITPRARHPGMEQVAV